MKLSHRFGVKALAVFLFVLIFSASGFSCFGLLVMESLGMFGRTADEVFKDRLTDQLSVVFNSELDACYNLNGDPEAYRDHEPAGDALRCELTDRDGTVIWSNLDQEPLLVSDTRYLYLESYGSYKDWYTSELSNGNWLYKITGGYTESGIASSPRYQRFYQILSWLCNNLYWGIAAASCGLILSIFLFIFLMCAAGHRGETNEIFLNWIDRIPLDLFVVLCAGAEFFLLTIAYSLLNSFSWGELLLFGDRFVFLALFALLLAFSCVFILFFMSFAARVKKGHPFRNTLLYYLGKGIVSLFRLLPLAWQTALAVIGFLLLNGILIVSAVTSGSFFCVFLYGLLWIGAFVLLVRITANFKKLTNTAQQMAAGHYSRIDITPLHGELRRHGEALNSLQNGLQLAVDRQMKSERMKTELITNVSHDIKTPLTSIINYVNLLKNAPDTEKQKEYLEVLDRQSNRLKRLTENLVEASKAASGTLPFTPAPLDICQLTKQAVGEYADRLSAAQLTPVISARDPDAFVFADGKLVWRIMDNLLSNACKYSQPGTRLYIDVWRRQKDVLIFFKNISREPLNISPDELTERFVRGDQSRSTEGSGLGLNIAKSLAELQNGSLTLGINGDLFSVGLNLPLCSPPPASQENVPVS